MAMHSNKYKAFTTSVKTPGGVYDSLNKEFNFDFDPCPFNKNWTVDGLAIDWGKRCFVNPPYGKAIRGWLEKALSEIEKGNTEVAVFLLPSYTDVKWFHEIVLPEANEIRFFKGRLNFYEDTDKKGNAPFASVLVVFKAEAGAE